MFKCEKCDRQTESKEKMSKIPVKTREKTYPGGYTGHETVKEISICKECRRTEK